MSRKLTQIEYENKVNKIFDTEYSVLGKYNGSGNKILIRHNLCMTEFSPYAGNFIRKKQLCPFCTSGSIITKDIFIKQIKDVVGDEYTLMSEYQSKAKPVKMRHNACSHPQGFFDYNVTPHGFMQGKRCPYEAHHHQVLTIEDAKSRLFEHFPTYTLLSTEYVNATAPLDVLCDKKHLFLTNLNRISNHVACPYCTNHKVWPGFNDINTTHPQVSKYLENYDDGYKYGYFTRTKLKFICPYCKRVHCKVPQCVLDANGRFVCDCCSVNLSYPERLFRNILLSLDIDFVYQLTKSRMKWCGKYRYDFYLPSYNVIIELHGMQHYITEDLGYIKSNIETDKIKRELALKNGYEVVEIDARYSNADYIYKNILSSRLSDLIDFSNVDISRCNKMSCKPILMDVVDIWKSGIQNVQIIGKILNIADTTVYKYLDKAAFSNLINFDHKKYREQAIRHNKNIIPYNAIKIKCVETEEEFNSFNEARNKKHAYLTKDIVNNPNKTSAGCHWITI